MLIKLAALGALGYAGYKYFEKSNQSPRAAFAGNQGDALVRDAGADSMRDTPQRWSRTDETLDESFPASDATAKY